jgi:chemotaxis protein methyltransferase CheR
VLIYFNQNLQNKVQTLFYDSLINGGIFLGSKESIQFTDYFAKYSELDPKTTFSKKNTKMQYQAIVIGVSSVVL